MNSKDVIRFLGGQVRWGMIAVVVFLGLGGRAVLAGDREEVAILVHSFATRGDRIDAAPFRMLFVTEPEIEVGTKGKMSPDVFFSAWTKRLIELKTMGGVRRQHVTTFDVEIRGSGRASATASVLTTLVQNNEIQMADTGSVNIEAVKSAGVWKIKNLKLTSDTTRLDWIRLELDSTK
jgi:hypothetical protein